MRIEMARMVRKTTPGVKRGRVQRKNRPDLSPHYTHAQPGQPVIDRHRPGKGYRHLLLKRDIKRFLDLLPEWEELSRDLKAVVLAEGEPDCFGWHMPGIVAVCAWSREIAGEWYYEFVEEHADVLDRLQVGREKKSESTVHLNWTEQSAKGFQLMHVLLHELGHHHDRVTTRSQREASRGERYAEKYARDHGKKLWDAYFKAFKI